MIVIANITVLNTSVVTIDMTSEELMNNAEA
jgi:hypothetical protein